MKRSWKSLSYENWPERDRVAWQDVLRDGDVLDGRGAGAHWAAATRRTNLRQYAGWLGWLAANGKLDETAAPQDRATAQKVEAYVRDLMAAVAPKTVDSALRGLKVVIKAMAPEQDWRWLMDMSNRFKSWAKPSRDQALPAISARDMFHVVLAELDLLKAEGLLRRKEQLAYRDTLIVAMLICAPIRLRNLTMIRVGVHLEKLGRNWHLRFAADETKNKQPLHLVLTEALDPFIGTYLDRVRPVLPGSDLSDHLWIGQKGTPMADITIYNSVIRASKSLFGSGINPHKFRSVTATFLAETSPADALRARSLLGHRNLSTTEDHYIKARQIEASNKVNNVLQGIRDQRDK